MQDMQNMHNTQIVQNMQCMQNMQKMQNMQSKQNKQNSQKMLNTRRKAKQSTPGSVLPLAIFLRGLGLQLTLIEIKVLFSVPEHLSERATMKTIYQQTKCSVLHN